MAGQELRFGSPQAAMETGIATLFQELSTVGGLSVAENVLLGRPTPSRLGVVDWRAVNAAASELFSTLGQDIDVTQDADRLSPVGKTMTALARALSQESRVLILDEPTAALTDAETSQLFAAIRRLQDRGVAILYVSHRLEEVFGIASRYSVLRNGRKVDEGRLRDTSVDGVIAAMAGRPIDAVFPSWEPAVRDVRIRVDRPERAPHPRCLAGAPRWRSVGGSRVGWFGPKRVAPAHRRSVAADRWPYRARWRRLPTSQRGPRPIVRHRACPTGTTLAGARPRHRGAQPQQHHHRWPGHRRFRGLDTEGA